MKELLILKKFNCQCAGTFTLVKPYMLEGVNALMEQEKQKMVKKKREKK